MRLIDAEILEKKIKEYFKITIDKTDNVDCVLEYNKQICNIIKSEPTAYDVEKAVEKQISNGWIPVSKRLPNKDECQKNDCRFIATDGNRTYQLWFDYEDNYFCKCECNGLGLKRDKCAIAWMPLPEPYREENNERD